MPLHPVALELLKRDRPDGGLQRQPHGQPSPRPPPTRRSEQLGDAVSVYLDGGPCPDNVPSTIVDLTGTIPKVLRSGAISVDRLRAVSSVIGGERALRGASADVRPGRTASARNGSGRPRHR